MPAQEEDYFSKYLSGTPSPDDAKLEPKLQELLKKLYDRQREEAYVRIDEQRAELGVFGSESKSSVPPKILKDHREWDRHQEERFFRERERYISDYQRATSSGASRSNPAANPLNGASTPTSRS